LCRGNATGLVVFEGENDGKEEEGESQEEDQEGRQEEDQEKGQEKEEVVLVLLFRNVFLLPRRI
jgi:hypothetical protein